MRTVLVIDPCPIVRYGICRYLETRLPDLVCIEHQDPTAVRKAMPEGVFEGIIFEVDVVAGDGLRLLRTLSGENEGPRVLVYSHLDEAHFGLRALRAGALGFLRKDAPLTELADAVRRVLTGRRYMSAELADQLVTTFAGDSANRFSSRSPHERLSDRELQVLRLLASGEPTADIARRLSISVKTVNSHRRNISRKLGLNSSSKLRSYAYAEGLVPSRRVSDQHTGGTLLSLKRKAN